MRDAGYAPAVVFGWLDRHCTKREDGRYLTIDGRLLDDSHRDTFDRWRGFVAADPEYRIPLGRWDEILFTYDIALWEVDHDSAQHHGWDGFLSSSPDLPR